MRIVLDARMAKMSGIGRYIDSLIPFLQKKYELILLGNPVQLGIYGSRIIKVGGGPYSVLSQAEIMLKTPGADLYWTPHFNAPLIPVRARKTAVTIHDVFHMTRLYRAGPLFKTYAGLLYGRALKGSDLVFTISDFTKNEIISYFPFMDGIKDKIKVIPRFPDGNFRPLQKTMKDKHEFLASKGLPDDFVLYVGNIKRHKNIEGLLQAVGIMKKKNSGLSLVCAGQRDNFITGLEGCDKLIGELDIHDRVYFTGVLGDEELVMLYNCARVLALPSFYEGFGLPPLEAFACGCPAVVSDIPPLREICSDAALYVEPSSYMSIADGLMEAGLNEEVRRVLIKKGREQVLKYARKDIEEEYLKLIDELLRQED